MSLLVDKCRKTWEQKAKVEQAKEKLAKENAKLTALKKDVEKLLEKEGLDKQHIPGHGTLSRQKKFSVKVPKTPDDKKALFDWIRKNKGEDVLFNWQSIASATVNSMFKAELEIAKKEGNINFSIPGIGAPKVYFDIGMVKSR